MEKSDLSQTEYKRILSISPRVAVILACIVFGSGYLRFSNLQAQGILYWDEGLFLLGARFFQWRILDLLGFTPGPISGFPVFLDKPAHVILLALFGSGGLKPITAATWSALSGTLTVIVVFFAGRKIAGDAAGLGTAACLGISSYHLCYSRAGLHEADSTFLVASAIYLVLRNSGKTVSVWERFIAGSLFGIAILASYRWIFLPPLILGFEGLWSLVIGKVPLKSRLKAELAGWMGVLLPLGFMELIYRAVFSGSFGVYTVPSYFFHLAHKFSAEGHINFVNLDFYPWMYSRVEGWFVLGIAASAILWNFRPLKIDRILISLSVFAPVILFSLAEERLARAITVVLPWISVCIGIMIADLWKNSWTRILSICIACIMIWSATIHIPPVLQIRSGYSQAIDWIQSQGHGTGHFSTMMPVSAFLVGERSQGCPPPLLRYLKFGTQGDLGTPDPGQGLLSQCAIYPPATLRELSLAARILGFRYLLTDWQKHVAFHPSILEIETNCAPVAIFDNPMVQYPTVLHENYLPEDAEELPKWDPSVYKILIFDLDTCLPDIESSL